MNMNLNDNKLKNLYYYVILLKTKFIRNNFNSNSFFFDIKDNLLLFIFYINNYLFNQHKMED